MAIHRDFPTSPYAILNYEGATETSKILLNWWFNTEHITPKSDGSLFAFRYYFAKTVGIW
ncbi:MAG: hypothetical protein ABSA71_12580 [Desulfomonilia bacterium]|jgi:type III restriction enzyme